MNKNLSHLAPSAFHVLFALHNEELHGYEILQRVQEQSEGKVSLLTGTLYNILKRLLETELICETKKDTRRRYYRLTQSGTDLVSEELERYQHIVALANSKKGAGYAS